MAWTRSALPRASRTGPLSRPGEPPADDLQGVPEGVVEIEPTLQGVREEGEATADHRHLEPETLEGGDRLLGSRGQGHGPRHLVERIGGEPLEEGHPAGERLREVELPGHGPAGDPRHLVERARPAGQLVDHLARHQGHVRVQDHDPLALAVDVLASQAHVDARGLAGREQGPPERVDVGDLGCVHDQLRGADVLLGEPADAHDVGVVVAGHPGDPGDRGGGGRGVSEEGEGPEVGLLDRADLLVGDRADLGREPQAGRHGQELRARWPGPRSRPPGDRRGRRGRGKRWRVACSMSTRSIPCSVRSRASSARIPGRSGPETDRMTGSSRQRTADLRGRPAA